MRNTERKFRDDTRVSMKSGREASLMRSLTRLARESAEVDDGLTPQQRLQVHYGHLVGLVGQFELARPHPGEIDPTSYYLSERRAMLEQLLPESERPTPPPLDTRDVDSLGILQGIRATRN